MTTNWLKLALPLLVTLAIHSCLSGCAPTAFPKEMSEVFRAVATSMTDQAKWDSITGNVRGHVLNPGFRGEGGVVYFAQGTLTGVDGDVNLAGAGKGGELSDAARAKLLEEIRSEPTLAEVALAAIQAHKAKAASQPK